MDRAKAFLQKYWGYTTFRPLQQEIISSVLAGRDTLGILATGSGKSLCYQLPTLCLGGTTLVVSPLIALMKDQVDDLNHRGISAAAWTGFIDARERLRIESGLREGTLRVLFVSPEKCVQGAFLSLLHSCPIRLVAIDEAHCISAWGHNFRPEYRQLASIRKAFPAIPFIALTATATPDVRRDIAQQLGLLNPAEFVGSFDRPNLTYCVQKKKNPEVFLRDYLGRHRHDSGIIYCMSRHETEDIAGELKKRGFAAAAYHAGLPQQIRESVQEAFLKGDVLAVCATVAFGMGIDKPDVRFVIHTSLPRSPEAYYQETGRAGRDGKAAECILLYSPADAARLRALIGRDESTSGGLRVALAKLDAIREFCEAPGCRRQHLLRYFGEAYPHDTCRACDFCTGVAEKGAEDALFVRLKALRKDLAGKHRILPYMVFPDKTLRAMAESRPTDREGFATISGVGPFKLARYGQAFLEAIRAG
jgi:ATP-dependent DNA helicase RecQ